MESPETEQEAHAMISTITHPQWEMPKDCQRMIPMMLMEIAAKKKDGKYVFSTRARQRAMEALGKFGKLNWETTPPAQPPQMHVHTEATPEDLRKLMQDDPEYLEYLRDREADSDTGTVCEESIGGAVEAGESPADDRQGVNERDNGARSEAADYHDASEAREE